MFEPTHGRCEFRVLHFAVGCSTASRKKLPFDAAVKCTARTSDQQKP
jgi:hypothetical protein